MKTLYPINYRYGIYD